jgi:hypothetical protein
MAILAAPTEAIREDFGGIVQQGVAGIQAQQEKERLKKEADYKKMLDFEDRYGIDESLFQLEDTAFRTVNDVKAEAISFTRDAYYDTYKELQKDPMNLDLKKKLGRIKNSVVQLGTTHEKFVALGEDYMERLKNDQISGVDEDEVRDLLTSYDKGLVKMEYDKDFNMKVLTYGEDGKLRNVKAYKDLVNQTIADKVQVDDEVSSFVKTIGRTKDTTFKGGIKTVSDTFGVSQQEMTNQWIEAQVGKAGDEESLKDNDVLADLLNQATNGQSRKKTGFTEEERSQVKDWLTQKVKGSYGTTIEKDRDALALVNARATTSGTPTTPVGAASISLSMGVDDAPQVGSDGSLVYTLNSPSKIDATKSDRAVNRIRYNPKTDSITLEAQDKVKLKGIQEMNEIKEKEPQTLFEQILGADGTVQYYKIDSMEISSNTETGLKEINTYANYNQMGDASNLKSILKQKYYNKFDSQEQADQYLGQPKKEPQQPKVDFTPDQLTAAQARIELMRKKQQENKQ